MQYYQSQGLGLALALDAFELTRHQYYYRPKALCNKDGAAQPGCSASTHTLHQDANGMVCKHPNEVVLRRIQAVQQDDDLRCGYKRMTAHLQLEGYQINHKKVYRLMRINDLLLSRLVKVNRPYVKHLRAQPEQPLTLLEMDIKMIWVEEHRRYAFILTILDTFNRIVLNWQVGYSMKWEEVRRAWEWVIEHHLQPADMLAKGLHIEIRNDNGPQFLAGRLREFFAENHLAQVFTHPYTPQENGHVESFHSILSQALAHEHFWTLQQLEARLAVFYDKYNNQRIHSATAHLPPRIFQQAWEMGLIQTREGKRKKTIFSLKVPRYQLSGYLKSEGASRSDTGRLDADLDQPKPQMKVSGAVTKQPSV